MTPDVGSPKGLLVGHFSRLLYVKLLRDIKEHGWQFAAVVVVVLLGVAMYGASYDSYQDLRESYAQVHTRYRFADLTFSGGPWSPDAIDRVRAVPGVAAAEGRAAVDPSVRIAGRLKLMGRVLGIPRYGQPTVNRLEVVSGRWPVTGDDMWVFVGKQFADAHRLGPGSWVEIKAPSGWARYRVEGVVISPEYIWASRSRQDIMPSTDNFGVFFAPDSAAKRIAGIGRQVNEVVLFMGPDASEAMVRRGVTGVLGAPKIDTVTPKREQASNETLQQDVDQFRELSGFFPGLFLGIGAISIYVMLTRLVHAQRPQIGLLRASGYARGTVVRHYLAFGAAIAVVGGIPGVLLGSLLSRAMTEWYVTYLTIPVTVTGFYPKTMATGLSLSLIACLLAAWAPARAAAKISPADAMRGETPAGGGRISVFERVFPALRHLSALGKIPLRSIGRSRRRAAYTVLGIVFANILILVSLGMLDSVDYLLNQQFFVIQKQDVHVIFTRPLPVGEALRLSRIRGVRAAEPVTELPVTLRHGGNSYSTALIGLVRDTQMRDFRDAEGRRLALPADGGLLLGTALRKKLGVEAGDYLTVEVPDLDAAWSEKVAGFETEVFGTFAYATQPAVSRRLAAAYIHSPDVISAALGGYAPALGPSVESAVRRGPMPDGFYAGMAQLLGVTDRSVTSMYVTVAPGARKHVMDTLRDKDSVAAAEDSRAMYELVQSYMGLMYVFMGVMLGFGAIMAFSLIFNTMSVNIFERVREVVTLRTLGIRQRQISYLITAENMLLAALGIVPGLIVGYLFAKLAMSQYSSDLFSYSLYMYPRSYVLTAVLIQLTALLAQFPALRAVHRVDLTKVIKERAS